MAPPTGLEPVTMGIRLITVTEVKASSTPGEMDFTQMLLNVDQIVSVRTKLMKNQIGQYRRYLVLRLVGDRELQIAAMNERGENTIDEPSDDKVLKDFMTFACNA